MRSNQPPPPSLYSLIQECSEQITKFSHPSPSHSPLLTPTSLIPLFPPIFLQAPLPLPPVFLIYRRSLIPLTKKFNLQKYPIWGVPVRMRTHFLYNRFTHISLKARRMLIRSEKFIEDGCGYAQVKQLLWSFYCGNFQICAIYKNVVTRFNLNLNRKLEFATIPWKRKKLVNIFIKLSSELKYFQWYCYKINSFEPIYKTRA